MGQTLVNFRMEEDLKRDMERVCTDLGMNMTTAFTIYAKKMTRERRIPFEVSADPFYSEKNRGHLRQAAADADAGRNMEFHDLIEVDDA
jgi:DNA-damage-inducible protein J